jgi:hypothetical protein
MANNNSDKKAENGATTTSDKKSKNQNIANDIFKRKPDVNEVYFTSDNMPFYTKNDASNHAKTLKNPNIETIKK